MLVIVARHDHGPWCDRGPSPRLFIATIVGMDGLLDDITLYPDGVAWADVDNGTGTTDGGVTEISAR